MRILMDATVVRRPGSGVQLAVLEEARALVRTNPGHEILILGTDADLPGDAVQPAPAWTAGGLGRVLWQQLILPNRARDLNADLLYSPAYTTPLTGQFPRVLHVHDTIALSHPGLCSRRNLIHMRALLARSAHRADRILASTQFVAEELARHTGVAPAKIRVVPLGVDADRFSTGGPRPRQLPHHCALYLLFVGNLEPKKGVDLLLDTFAEAAIPASVHLVLAGRWAWKCAPLLARLNSHPHRSRIHVLGRVSDDDLPALYANAAAFVFPSVVEGFGLPVLEAMAAGTPVVHSSQPSLVEAAGSAAYRVESRDAKDWAAAIAEVVTDIELRERLMSAGRRRAAVMTWDRWGECAWQVFEALHKCSR